ncbi:arrestin domain-containing protein 3-like isoform 2-T2 [Cochliomyia hominivorax]
MPSSCKFEFNKPRAIYYSGEITSGTITLTTSSDKNVRDVSIIFKGEGKVKWEESTTVSSGEGTTTQTTHYVSHEKYIDNSTLVHGDGTLPKGKHTYNFNIPLPLQCPTSLEGKFGHIRYEITLKINRYYRFDNIYKKPITIIKTIDLNLNPYFKIPVAVDTVGNLCCWPCSSGNIIYTLTVPFGAFAAGQTLKYTLHIKNNSMTDVISYYLQFIRKIVFTANSPSKRKRYSKDILISKIYKENCLRLTNRVIEGEMHIPSTPPTTSHYAIIYVSYIFKAVLQLSGCNSNMEIEIPIIIGTIPIWESLPISSQQQSEQITAREEIAECQETDDCLPTLYKDINLPTFEEATSGSAPFIDTDDDPRNRIVDFKPLYPMYKN